jgi:trigger factor
VKTDVEELSPTRVRLTVEVGFDELKPNLDQAYREVGRQVRIPGFRPGHVPRQVLDQRIGRDAVLEQAVNDAVPDLYQRAVREAQVFALGQPEVAITRIEDGSDLAFTAEVDIRPSFELPDIGQLSVLVDDADVGPDQVEQYLGALRERFATLRAADRPAQAGDYVSIDLSAAVDGEPVADAQANGISYEVGSGTILDGLDEALAGMSADESATFQTELAGGERAGSLADVTVGVRSVKVKELPDLDDDFAQSASEFNTVGELRANTRKQLEAINKAGQGAQARDRAVEALVDRVDMPLPEAVVEHEIEHRSETLAAELDRAGLTMQAYLEGRGITYADLEKETADGARRSVKAQFILDKMAEQEGIGVSEQEIGQFISQLAYQQRVPPEQLAKQITSSGQAGAVVSDILRSKAADLLARRADVKDASGRKVAIGADDAGDTAEPADEGGAEESAPAGEAPKAKAGRRAGRGRPKSDLASRQSLRLERTSRHRGLARPHGRLMSLSESDRQVDWRDRSCRAAGSPTRALRATDQTKAGGTATMWPKDESPAGILARAQEAPLLPLGDQLFQRLLRHRIIFLGQQVDDEIANRICAEIVLLAAEDPKRDISIYINSPGGSVSAGLAIYDVMQYVPNDIATYAMGLAASMGQFLLCAGAQGKRYAMPHAQIMLHQPHGGIGGTASDVRIQAEQILYIKRILAERTALHTGQTVEQIEKDSDRDRWFTADEAKDYGFVDRVVRSATEVPSEGAVS